MRLAVFTNNFPDRVSTFFARDMRGLINAGIQVDIFPFYPLEPALWHYVPEILNETILPRKHVHHINVLNSIRHARLSRAKLRTFLGDFARIEAAAMKFGTDRLVKTTYVGLKALGWAWSNGGHYDHILAYWGNYAGTCAYIFHRLMDQPVPFSMFLHAGMDLYEGQVYLREKLLYADNIIIVCEYNRQFLRNEYNEMFPRISSKIYKHHLGLDLTEFAYNSGDSRSPNTVLAVGSLEKYKGFDYLLRAGHLMSQQGSDYQIDFIGDGAEADSLKRLAAELRITQRVNFRGWMPPHQVRNAMSHATILVHPSYGVGDAVPTVVKEAMALGTPVIASELAGIPELLDGGRCGMLVPPGNPYDLAQAIRNLLADHSLRRRYAESARKHAEETFDLWRNGRQLAALLSSTKRQHVDEKTNGFHHNSWAGRLGES